MNDVFDDISGLQITIAAVVGLIGLCTLLAWLPATRRDPTGPATRVFITVGLAATVLDPQGVGAVLGLSLAAMGGLVWWGGQPPPEVPRPRRRGFYVASVLAGVLTYGTVEGWGPLSRVPEDGRPVVALFVGIVVLLATLAIADRARITFRDRLRRRFAVGTPTPRVLVAPIDRPPPSTVTLERLASQHPDTGSDHARGDGTEPQRSHHGRAPAAISAAEVVSSDPTPPEAPESTETAPDGPAPADSPSPATHQTPPGPPPPPPPAVSDSSGESGAPAPHTPD